RRRRAGGGGRGRPRRRPDALVDLRLGAPTGLLEPASVARAARVLWVRSRREATSWLVGGYASAFRGGGVEFEELRPYVPGDDVRSIDWNATARSGEPWVKRFREERAHTVLLLLDVSASIGFGTVPGAAPRRWRRAPTAPGRARPPTPPGGRRPARPAPRPAASRG